ncbi:MAG TPA: cellulase family glycosylhydrolase [Candidatus Hydrogenedentes bacterium]|nr:cellulase family glycosylhydrolase [Candidatus Hydrogenedentota bacterium]HQM47182.1 cellulase family glycosylhydrolase [Candidatus Hydrogenedentota bacterium]
MNRIGVLAALCMVWAAGVRAAEQPPGLSVSKEGVLLKDGQPYRGIGVNYFNAFLRRVQNPQDTSYREGFKTLSGKGIPFARFAACGFWPVEWRLYREDKEAYLKLLDDVVRTAEEAGVGLIPSMFWFDACVPDIVGEPRSAWGDPESKTIAFMRQYVADVVPRYVDSPAIWAWELGNEYDLAADLPNASTHRPYVLPRMGTASERTERDDMTTEMLVSACREFARAVRQYDSHRAITTGNSLPRPAAHHMHTEGTWTHDTREQLQQRLILTSPDPVNLVSVHVYPFDREARFDGQPSYEEILSLALAACKGAGKALFVGEFGAADDGKHGGPQGPEHENRAVFDAIVASGVPLAAIWAYDLEQQKDTFSITPDNDRAYLLDLVAEANKRMNP